MPNPVSWIPLPPYFETLPVDIDAAEQARDRLNRYFELQQTNITAVNAAQTSTAQAMRTTITEQHARQMQERWRAEYPRFWDQWNAVRVHDEWTVRVTPQVRTPKTIATAYAGRRAIHKSNFAKFEERVNEIRNAGARRDELRPHAAKTTRSFSSW